MSQQPQSPAEPDPPSDQQATSDPAPGRTDEGDAGATGDRMIRLGSAEIRVLAHPVRARLLSALRLDGPATATGLATRLGTNSGATSYHLRQLAEVGLVEEDPGRGTARERWWRPVHGSSRWNEVEFADDPDDRAAADWLLRHHTRTVTNWIGDWLDERQQWPEAWRRAADHSDYQLHTTPEGLQALNDELHDVIRRHKARWDTANAGTERVTVLLHGFPLSGHRRAPG